MEKLKCTSCGATLEVEDNKEFARCKYCGSKYKLNQDINIKLDDNIKDVVNGTVSSLLQAKVFLFIPIIIFVIVFIIIATIGTSFFTGSNDYNYVPSYSSSSSSSDAEKKAEEEKMKQELKEQAEQEMKKRDVQSFNFSFSLASGTKVKDSVEHTIDSIISSNKKNERKIALVYNGKSTTDESEIIKIKNSLPDYKGHRFQEYEVSVDYDSDGYINKIIVKKL